MYEGHRHRSLADGRGDAFDRIGTDVAGSEYAWTASLQQEWLSAGSPMSRLCQSRAGPDKPLHVSINLCGQPVGSWHRPDELE